MTGWEKLEIPGGGGQLQSFLHRDGL